MSNKEYVLLNVFLVALLFGLFFVAFISNPDTNWISCQVLEVSGKECSSCGLTRDFIAFSHFDFRTPINSQSINVFIWFFCQLIFRAIIVVRSGIVNSRLKMIDFVISVITGVAVFFPFWI